VGLPVAKGPTFTCVLDSPQPKPEAWFQRVVSVEMCFRQLFASHGTVDALLLILNQWRIASLVFLSQVRPQGTTILSRAMFLLSHHEPRCCQIRIYFHSSTSKYVGTLHRPKHTDNMIELLRMEQHCHNIQDEKRKAHWFAFPL
jgi:hypothetical protein